MIEVIKKPDTHCLVGNPVIIRLRSDDGKSIPYTIEHGSEKVELRANFYKSGQSYYCDADISNVLKSFFGEGLPLYGETISIAPYPEFVKKCQVTVANNEFTIHAIDGGVSNEALSTLSEYGMSMFDFRLFNSQRSMLFTTRSNTSTITLRESELFPFVFIHPGKAISFMSESGFQIQETELLDGVPCLMDLAYVRTLFQDIYDELPSQITIQVAGEDSTTIKILPSKRSENICWLFFKNSLGAYECKEVTGKGYYTPTFSKDNTHQQHIESGIFKNRRNRLEIQKEITIQTGYNSQDELEFLQDLIATDRCYLLLPDSELVECIPTVDDVKYPMRVTEPTSLELKLKMIHNSRFHTPKIDIAKYGLFVWDGEWDDEGRWYDNKQIKDNK